MLAAWRVLFPFASLLFLAVQALAAEPATTPPMGVLAGSVAWAGAGDDAGLDLGDIHAFDIEGHPEVTAGLEKAVVIAEPLDAAAKGWLRRQRPEEQGLSWNPVRENRVAATAPSVPLAVHSDIALRLFLGGKLLQTLAASERESSVILPEGIVRVLDAQDRVGWVYVTPDPAAVSGGNCRFSFRVPQGRYRLRAWHPRLGQQERVVQVDGRPRVRLQLLIFRRAQRDRAGAQPGSSHSSSR